MSRLGVCKQRVPEFDMFGICLLQERFFQDWLRISSFPRPSIENIRCAEGLRWGGYVDFTPPGRIFIGEHDSDF